MLLRLIPDFQAHRREALGEDRPAAGRCHGSS
jgi:hypothetical protein